jgi:hypothetical protein
MASRSDKSLIRDGDRKTDPLLRRIRALALKEQEDSPQVFLSLREAAHRFAVPVSAVAGVYRQLVEERVLSSVRGSRTVLSGRSASRMLSVRGLVSLPLSLPRLSALPDYRECFLRIQRELHKRGYAIIPNYIEDREISADLLIDRAKQDKSDTVLWIVPDRASGDIHLRLRDLGIKFVGLNIAGASGAFCRYEIRRQGAILTILNDWRADDRLTKTLIVTTGQETAVDLERLARLRDLLKLEVVDADLVTVPQGRISRFLKSLCGKHKGILLPGTATAMLASRAPDTIANVLETCRIALIDGPPSLPFSENPPDVAIDTVDVNWRYVAKRIAQDMVTEHALKTSEATVFEGEAHLRVPMRKFSYAS